MNTSLATYEKFLQRLKLNYLPLACFETFRVQVRTLNSTKEVLDRSSSKSVGPAYHYFDALASQIIVRLLATVVASAVEQQYRLLFPVLVLLIQLDHQPLQVQAQLLATCVDRA